MYLYGSARYIVCIFQSNLHLKCTSSVISIASNIRIKITWVQFATSQINIFFYSWFNSYRFYSERDHAVSYILLLFHTLLPKNV